MTLAENDEQFERTVALVADTLAEHVGEFQYDFEPEARAVVQALMRDGWTR